MKKNILVVGALPEAFEEIRRALEDDSTVVIYSGSINDAINTLSLIKIILVIMELTVFCSESDKLSQILRRQKPVPVLILFTNADIIDDYWELSTLQRDLAPVPFEMRNWSINVKAYIEQHAKLNKDGSRAYILACGEDLRIEPGARAVYLRGEKVELSEKQFDLLYILASHRGQVLSKEQLFSHLWNEPNVDVDNSVELHISRLRKKLCGNPGTESFIQTIRGRGYKIDHEPII